MRQRPADQPDTPPISLRVGATSRTPHDAIGTGNSSVALNITISRACLRHPGVAYGTDLCHDQTRRCSPKPYRRHLCRLRTTRIFHRGSSHADPQPRSGPLPLPGACRTPLFRAAHCLQHLRPRGRLCPPRISRHRTIPTPGWTYQSHTRHRRHPPTPVRHWCPQQCHPCLRFISRSGTRNGAVLHLERHSVSVGHRTRHPQNTRLSRARSHHTLGRVRRGSEA